MNITLSWDLFVIVFFIIIVSYSFIIGTNRTLKVILGTYIAALAADAAGIMLGKALAGSKVFASILDLASVGNNDEAVVLVKVAVFVVLLIFIAVKGAYEVDTPEDNSMVIRAIMNAVYAVMSAGLIISVILIFVSGVSFVSATDPETSKNILTEIANQSEIVASIIKGTYLWFSVPAIAFMVHSFYGPGGE